MDAAHDRRRHLGEILVEEGFITPDALAGALERQESTQRPLGEVVVELGLVSPGAVANALAEQHGGVLRTEYGISAGFRPTVVEAPEAEAPDDTAGEPVTGEPVTGEPFAAQPVAAEPAPDVLDAWRAALAERDGLLLELSDAVRSRDAEIAALREQLAAAASPAAEADPDQVAEWEGERAELRAELSARAAEVDRVREESAIAVAAAEARAAELAEKQDSDPGPDPGRIAELESEHAELRAELAARTTEIDRVHEEMALAEAAAESRAAELARSTAELAQRTEELAQRTEELAQRSVELAQRSEELESVRLRLAEAEAEPEPVEPEVEAAHVLLVPTREGYELLDRDGPAPARGSIVELEVAYVVSSIGAAPLPGTIRCAFLERA